MTIVGAQRAAAEYGSLLLLMNSGTDADLEQREIRALLDRQVDGIVYAVRVPPPGAARPPAAAAKRTPYCWTRAPPDRIGHTSCPTSSAVP